MAMHILGLHNFPLTSLTDNTYSKKYTAGQNIPAHIIDTYTPHWSVIAACSKCRWGSCNLGGLENSARHAHTTSTMKDSEQ